MYSVISNNGYCGHVLGKFPYQCTNSNVASQSECEDHCTALSSCVGYDYMVAGGTKPLKHRCGLFPSVRNCPSGFKSMGNWPIATTMNDLKEVYDTNWICFGKN